MTEPSDDAEPGPLSFSLSIASADRDALREALRDRGEDALVAPVVDGALCAFPSLDAIETWFAIDPRRPTTPEAISERLDAPVLVAVGQDGDLALTAFRDGAEVVEIVIARSDEARAEESPGPSPERIAKLCAAFDRADAASRIEGALHDLGAATDPAATIEAHRTVAAALGLPAMSAGLDFQGIISAPMDGKIGRTPRIPAGLSRDDFVEA